MTKRLVTILAISAAATALVACGDDDEDGTEAATTETTTAEATTAEAISEEEFIAQANAVCARINDELEEVDDFEQDAPPIIERGLDDLREIPPPEGEEAQVDAFIAAGQAGVEQLERLGDSADVFDAFTRLGEELGIRGGCVEA